MITDVVKRSFTKWLSGSEATPSFPTRLRKRAAANFSRACRIIPNEVKRMLHEVGNYSKTSEASFAVELKIGNPQTSLKNSARGEAALLRRVKLGFRRWLYISAAVRAY